MEKITLIKCEDGNIWVISDEDQIGIEHQFKRVKNESKQFMIALADFLGYEPANVLDFGEPFEDDEE